MELGNFATDSQPVVYDLSTLDRKESDLNLYLEFRSGKATFGNELYDAVAMSDGIDAEGKLDENMIEAFKAADEYLANRHGQPVVFAESIHDGDRLLRIDALVGTLAESGKLFGAMDEGGMWRKPGIKLKGACYELSANAAHGKVNLERSIPLDTDVMPLSRQGINLGLPGEDDNYLKDGRYHRQDIIAGEDILPWLAERFPEGRARYEIFLGLMQAVTKPEALEYIFQPPYTDMLLSEVSTLESAASVLMTARTKIKLHQRAITGAQADASLELAEIKEAAGELAYRLPYTYDSWRTGVASEVNGIDDIDRRLQTINKLVDSLRKVASYTLTKYR